MSSQDPILHSVSALQRIAPAGFAMALHIRFTTPTLLFQSYPGDWITHYTKHGLVMKDPTVHWGFENTGTIAWADLVSEDPANVIGQAADHGLSHGVTYAHASNNSISVSSFARSDRMFTAAEIQEVTAIVSELHSHTKDTKALPPAITARLRQMDVNTTLG